MKQTKKLLLGLGLMSVLIIPTALVSCTQEDNPDGGESQPGQQINLEVTPEGMLMGFIELQENKDLKIPTIYNGITITSISDNAFFKNQLTTLTFEPNSKLTTIGNQAFQDNKLTSLDIPDSVTSIGNQAFNENQITSLIIPNSVTSIGESAFRTNQLTSLTIPNSVTSIGDSAFYMNYLTSLTFEPNSQLTTIKDYAFAGSQLTSLTIPNSVTTIGKGTFKYTQLTSLTIPDSVTTIGLKAFEWITTLQGENISMHSKLKGSDPKITKYGFTQQQWDVIKWR